MAQANSVQREPSMEEILASIRRIIEDSDSARKVLDEEAIAPADAEPELEAEVEVEAFRDELKAEQAAGPVSLAQIQAEVARGPRLEQPAMREDWPKPLSSAPHVEEEPRRKDPHRNNDIELDFTELEQKPAAHAENNNPRQAILSEQAGRQIAASFGELSEAFASRRKSFDEMAEDMMRPMLQDWLDNNLPLLVEKLVREEIERVARGDAR